MFAGKFWNNGLKIVERTNRLQFDGRAFWRLIFSIFLFLLPIYLFILLINFILFLLLFYICVNGILQNNNLFLIVLI